MNKSLKINFEGVDNQKSLAIPAIKERLVMKICQGPEKFLYTSLNEDKEITVNKIIRHCKLRIFLFSKMITQKNIIIYICYFCICSMRRMDLPETIVAEK